MLGKCCHGGEHNFNLGSTTVSCCSCCTNIFWLKPLGPLVNILRLVPAVLCIMGAATFLTLLVLVVTLLTSSLVIALALVGTIPPDVTSFATLVALGSVGCTC